MDDALRERYASSHPMYERYESIGCVPRNFTPYEAARVCGVSPQRINKSFDAGDLKGFKVPNSRFRRITADELQAFLDRSDKVIDVPLGIIYVVLTGTEEVYLAVKKLLQKTLDRVSIHITDEPFIAGMLHAEQGIDKLFFDGEHGAKLSDSKGFTGETYRFRSTKKLIQNLSSQLLFISDVLEKDEAIPERLLRPKPVQSKSPNIPIIPEVNLNVPAMTNVVS